MYSNIWKKYMPIIRLLLKKAVTTDQVQVLAMDRFDFEKVNKARKPLCAFSLELIRGKVSPLIPPAAGKEFIEVIMADSNAVQIIRQHHFAISLANNFKLQISNAAPAESVAAEESASSESE